MDTFGTNLRVTLFGESHGPYIGATLDGLAPGLTIDEDYIRRKLSFRRPVGKISTGRVEEDRFSIISGIYQGKTTGTPLTILIPNENVKSADYERIFRPGHADYTGYCKYHGFEDYHGGGHFSGRITAALVAAGAIAEYALEQKGIRIGTHILDLCGIKDRHFAEDPAELTKDIQYINEQEFAVFSPDVQNEMIARIEEAAKEGDSVGGILESAVTGLPAGVGEPWFESVESKLSQILFAIPAVKGVQFGLGFDGSDVSGKDYNDAFATNDGTVITKTNHNGGINGGITNGMPILFSCAVKPTPSIFTEQESVDPVTGENTTIRIKGRHDPAIIHRARIVVDCAASLALYDLLSYRFGTDYFMNES